MIVQKKRKSDCVLVFVFDSVLIHSEHQFTTLKLCNSRKRKVKTTVMTVMVYCKSGLKQV